MSFRFLSVVVAALFSALGVFALWFYVLAERLGFKTVESDPDMIAAPLVPVTQPEPEEKVEPVVAPEPEPKPVEVAPEPAAEPEAVVETEAEPVTEPEPEAVTESKPEAEAPSLPEMTGSQGAQNLVDSIKAVLSDEEEAAPASDNPDASAPAPDKAAAVLKLLQEGNLIKEVDATVLESWKANNKLLSVEHVGTFLKDGKTIARYRLVGDKGTDLLLDLEQPEDALQPWKVAQINPAAPANDSEALDANDSMQIVEGFISAVRQGEMHLARSFITGTQVSDVTIAGLCMVFAESGYTLRANRPIRSSFQNASSAAYLVYLQENESTVPVNVGIELKYLDGWHVSAVALDSLLSDYENSADAEGGRYFPLVKNPRGGDSIALFFAFDDSSLTPRSLSQLTIVAELLKPAERRLDISGHTDDVGGEAYNEKLSLRRAEAVKAALVSLGVDAEKISTEGMGMRQPRRSYGPKQEPSMLETERAENRRAEIYLDFQ